MLKLFIRITLSTMILYISTLSKVEACCCANIVPSQYTYCHDGSADNTDAVQIVKCQCDQQTSNTLADLSNPSVLLTTKHFSLMLAADNTLRSQTHNTIYRPPIFI